MGRVLREAGAEARRCSFNSQARQGGAVTDKRRQAPDIFREIIADDQDGHFRWYLQQARGGDDSAARELLDGFCCAVQEGERIPAPILEHLLFGLIRYLDDGVPLEKALHLNKPANRPRGVVTVDPVRAVATIYLYMKRDGLTRCGT
jgi:hypothetical protein